MMVVLMAATMLCMCPRLAYADTYVTDGGADKLDAVMQFLGYDPEEGTSEVQLKHAFVNAIDGIAPYTGFDRFKLFYDSVYSLNNSPQPVIQYWSNADGFLYANLLDGARNDASEIRNLWLLTNGQGNGGGSGSGDIGQSGSSIVFDAYKTVWFVTQDYWTGIWYDGAYGTVEGAPEPLVVKVPKTQMDSVRTYLGDNFRCCLHIANSNGNNTSGNIISYYVTFFDAGASYQTVNEETTYTIGGYNVIYSKACVGDGYASISDGAIVFDSVSFSNSSNGTYSNLKICYWSDVHYPSGGGGTTSDPTTPTDPPTSDPVQPAPTEPTYNTDITINVINLQWDTYTQVNDIQVNNDLSGVISLLKSMRIWLIYIDNSIKKFMNYFIYAMNTFGNDIMRNIKIIAENQILYYEHVNDLFEHTLYLLTHLQTGSNVEFDDNNIVTWLQMIYQRLLQWPSTRPSPDDPLGLGALLEWLANIIGKFFDALLGLSQADLTGLLQGVEGLTGKFPFSIPWDVGAVFALFAAPPVTPHVEYPLYSVGMDDVEHVTDVVVDLSDYDAYMAIVRGVELALFTAGLAWKTRDVMDLLGIAGGDT